MADWGLTESDAAIADLVSSVVQKQLIQEAKLMPLVQNFIAPPGMDTLKIPRLGDFTVATKSENTSLTAQVLTYATDDLVLNAHKAIMVRLEDIANVQATPDTVSEIISRMAKQLALDIDTSIVAVLETPSAAAPDHRVAYSGAALGKADILVARELLHIQNIPFNECYIGVHPTSEVALLAINDFVHANLYGSDRALKLGEIGTLYGAKVIMSNEFDALKTIVWHPTHMAFARQIMPRFETQRDIPNLANIYALSNLYGVKLLDSGKRAVMLGTAA